VTPESHSPHRRQRTVFEKLRTIFFAGVLVTVPVFVAFYAVVLIMGLADAIFGQVISEVFATAIKELADPAWLPVARALASFLLAMALIMLVGWLSTFWLVRRVIVIGERVIEQIPMVKFFYTVPKEVLNTFAVQQNASYKRVVLIEYPRAGSYGIGFATGELIRKPDNQVLVAVFLPTTPNPTSGFLLYLPERDVLDTNLTIEEGARLVISGGILSPLSITVAPFCGLDKSPNLPPAPPVPSLENHSSPSDSSA
jgi:uncharacterized membrane protein